TDRRIDRLVYEFYGLADAEIRLVEAATAARPRRQRHCHLRAAEARGRRQRGNRDPVHRWRRRDDRQGGRGRAEGSSAMTATRPLIDFLEFLRRRFPAARVETEAYGDPTTSAWEHPPE